MKKMRTSHLYALARAETFLISGITSQIELRHRRHIENDIELIKEVRAFVSRLLTEPNLPLFSGDPLSPDLEDTDGRTDNKPES